MAGAASLTPDSVQVLPTIYITVIVHLVHALRQSKWVLVRRHGRADINGAVLPYGSILITTSACILDRPRAYRHLTLGNPSAKIAEKRISAPTGSKAGIAVAQSPRAKCNHTVLLGRMFAPQVPRACCMQCVSSNELLHNCGNPTLALRPTLRM